MKQCSKCGKRYEDWNIFCRDCGVLLTPVAESPAEAAAPVVPSEPDSAAPVPVPEAPVLQSPPLPEVPQPASAPEPPRPAYDPIPEMFKDPPPPPPETEAPDKSRKPRDGSLPRLGFGRGLAFVLVAVLLFFLLAAPLCVYSIRDTATEAGLNRLLADVRVSEVPASELIPDVERGYSLSDWLLSLLAELLGSNLQADSGDVAEFLDRSTLKPSCAAAVSAVLADYFAGRGEQELSWYEYSQLLQENQGLFEDVFGLSFSAAAASQLARTMTAKGLPTLPNLENLKLRQPDLYRALHLGCSWVCFGVLLALALVLFLCLIKLGKSGLRAFRCLGILMVILGGVPAIVAIFARLFPAIWSNLLGLGYLIPTLSGAFLFGELLVNLGLLVLGILMLLIVRLIRAAMARHAARRQERLERKQRKEAPTA